MQRTQAATAHASAARRARAKRQSLNSGPTPASDLRHSFRRASTLIPCGRLDKNDRAASRRNSLRLLRSSLLASATCSKIQTPCAPHGRTFSKKAEGCAANARKARVKLARSQNKTSSAGRRDEHARHRHARQKGPERRATRTPSAHGHRHRPPRPPPQGIPPTPQPARAGHRERMAALSGLARCV